jgi:hypothetical protein
VFDTVIVVVVEIRSVTEFRLTVTVLDADTRGDFDRVAVGGSTLGVSVPVWTFVLDAVPSPNPAPSVAVGLLVCVVSDDSVTDMDTILKSPAAPTRWPRRFIERVNVGVLEAVDVGLVLSDTELEVSSVAVFDVEDEEETVGDALEVGELLHVIVGLGDRVEVRLCSVCEGVPEYRREIESAIERDGDDEAVRVAVLVGNADAD